MNIEEIMQAVDKCNDTRFKESWLSGSKYPFIYGCMWFLLKGALQKMSERKRYEWMHEHGIPVTQKPEKP